MIHAQMGEGQFDLSLLRHGGRIRPTRSSRPSRGPARCWLRCCSFRPRRRALVSRLAAVARRGARGG